MDRKTNEPSVSISDLATKRRRRELLLTNPQPESEEKHITEDFEDVVNKASVPAYSANTMINVTFKPEETRLAEMQKVFNGLGYDALFMSHYDLANYTKYSPIEWKEFITDPRVAAFISEEMELLKKAKLANMLKQADSNRNVGQVQLLNTLLNQTKNNDKKEGPAFVYCWVPLNENERHANNVEVQDVSLTEYFKNQKRPNNI